MNGQEQFLGAVLSAAQLPPVSPSCHGCPYTLLFEFQPERHFFEHLLRLGMFSKILGEEDQIENRESFRGCTTGKGWSPPEELWQLFHAPSRTPSSSSLSSDFRTISNIDMDSSRIVSNKLQSFPGTKVGKTNSGLVFVDGSGLEFELEDLLGASFVFLGDELHSFSSSFAAIIQNGIPIVVKKLGIWRGACKGCLADLDLENLVNPETLQTSCKNAGYHALEYLDTRQASQSYDVYRFGVLLLELLTGRSPLNRNLAHWAQLNARDGLNVLMYDVWILRNPIVKQEMWNMLEIALHCVEDKPENRPNMNYVVKMVELIVP
ncbi:unnamed protein product [Fraxinus pennsylvanica]|uniref:Protein kinase domain-containing protein n=1 Tax=Fraxinus pennsylvanica TaxID=56036 RepID=A0AAD1ZMM8_9LAMI|nr:unnamed protein product [Fraxinus pennsylvanica]